MRIRIVLLACGVMLVGGCSSVQTVSVSGNDASYREVNRAVRGKVAHLMLRNGTDLHVVGMNVATDNVTWVDRRSNRLESIPTGDVREIRIVKAGSGALRGLLVGAVLGAVAGGVRAVVEGDDPISDPLAVTREEKLRIYPAAHALLASLATTPLGAIIGKRKVYRFDSPVSQP